MLYGPLVGRKGVIWAPGPRVGSLGRWSVGSLECWIVYQESMVPSCGAGCRLLATWILAGYQGTDCLVTGLSFDGSPDSRNPMRSIVFGCLVGVVAVVNGSILGCWLQVADDLVTFWLPGY